MSASSVGAYESVIGLEVHVQLRTESKLFSPAPVTYGAQPNHSVHPICLGLPGVLPVLNARAVEYAMRAALATHCTVHLRSVFARKNYFYPDLPKGYQISQYEEPYALGGAVLAQIDGESVSFPLTRIHMEEDAAKSVHDSSVAGSDSTHVNLNRAGVPLIEIVSEPCMHRPEQAGAYLRSLRATLRHLEVTDADMEKGQFRFDANVSVRRVGETRLGVKVELKNLNSFRNVERALSFEIERQVEVLEDGGKIDQETRHWDERAGRSTPSRSKEDADDYRYFPDPDLTPLRVSVERVEEIREALPELPHQKRQRYQDALGLSAADAGVLSENREVALFFEETARLCGQAKSAAHWVMRDVLALVGESGQDLAALKLAPSHLARLIERVEQGSLTPASAREVLAEVARSGDDPDAVVTARGLEAVSDTGELEGFAREVIEGHPEQLAQFRAGEQKVMNFFIGQVMKKTRGKADPAVVRQLMARLLAG